MSLFIGFLGFQPYGAEGKVGGETEYIRAPDCLEQARQKGMRLEMAVLRLGEFRLNLVQAEERLDSPEFEHLAVGTKEQDFDEVMEAVKGRGYEILDHYTIQGKRLMFRDGNGMVIEVYPKEIYLG